MRTIATYVQDLHARLLSERVKHSGERIIVNIAIVSFLLHLVLIGLVNANLIHLNDTAKLLTNPISAIYTPFSFILIYEAYLLVYYLPRSISTYIGKQYEIITLIIVRRIFKDLANIELTENWFGVKGDLQLTYDIIATLVLFTLILIFYKNNPEKPPRDTPITPATASFIEKKKGIALVLVFVFIGLAGYSLLHWVYENFVSVSQMVNAFSDVNKVFFGEFFTILILTDVLLLLISLLNSDKFSKVIRNSGFIISTILIRLSFSTDGLLNTLLVVSAVAIGVIVLILHNQYEKIPSQQG